MSRLRGGLVALVAAAVALTGCTSTAPSGATATGPDAAAAPSGPPCLPPPTSAAAATADPAGLPVDFTLPCFAGGQPVRLAKLGTPAVINLWASWCQPCRTELPAMQQFADRTSGRVQVVGVITSDPNRTGAQALIDDLKLRFPMLYDEQGKLQAQIGPPVAMPTTLLVSADGRVVYRHTAKPLDEAALAELVRQHLGVAA